MRQGDSEGGQRAGARQGGDRPGGRVTVIGFDGQPPTGPVRAALAEATLVVGSIRHLDALPVPDRARRIYMGGLEAALTQLAVNQGPAVIVASGDPGFFGVVRALRSRGIAMRTLPAPSSVATAFGRIGLPWEDALVVTMGMDTEGTDGTEGRAGRPRARSTTRWPAGRSRPCAPRRTCAGRTRRWPC